MDLATQLLLCLTVAAMCAGLVRLVRIPLPVVQTLAGILLAWPLGVTLELDPDAFLLVLVPPLLFLDAWRTPKAAFHENRGTILMMAFGLVALTAIAVGLFAGWLVPAVPRPVAFAIAAALSPTDAVAVVAIIGRAPVPARLVAILDGEALFNDATALVAMRVAVATMVTGAFSWLQTIDSVVIAAAGGALVGVIVAWSFVRLAPLLLGREEGDVAPRLLLMLMLPFAAYLVAEHFDLSGVLAAVGAGMVANRVELIDPEHRTTRLQSHAVSNMIEGALNGLVFVLLGLQIPVIVREVGTIAADAGLTPLGLGIAIGLVFVALGAIRFVWVWVSLHITWLRAGFEQRPSARLVAAASVAGVRGAVSLAAALTLPAVLPDGSQFPARRVAIFVCAVVIVVWLVLASVLLPRLLRGYPAPAADTESDQRIRAALADAAIAALEQAPPSAAVAHVLALYRSRLRPDQPDIERSLRRTAIAAERAKLRELGLDEQRFAHYERELDLIEEAMAQ